MTGAAPQKREFQGTTIYDFDVNIPNQAAGGAQAALPGPISIAIAKDTLFMTSDTTLLEQVLRQGNPTLADSASFQSVAKEYPEKASGLSYVRPDESARLSYDLVKSGRFEKAIQQATAARGGGGGHSQSRQDHSRRQASGLLGFRQVSVARRRFQHDGRRRIHDDRLHAPPPRPVMFAPSPAADRSIDRSAAGMAELATQKV